MQLVTPADTAWSRPAGCLLPTLAAVGACTSGSPRLEENLRSIEALNQHEVDAVLSSDVDALISQWTDDFVARALEHVLDFEETIVSGDYAFQWSAFRSSSRARASGEVFSGSGKLMRILQRQADGSWKMHRTMTAGDPGGE